MMADMAQESTQKPMMMDMPTTDMKAMDMQAMDMKAMDNMPAMESTPVGCLPKSAGADNMMDEMKKESCEPPLEEGRVRADPNSEEAMKTKAEVESGEIPRDTSDSIEGSVKMQKMAYGEVTNPVCTMGNEAMAVPQEEWASCPGAPGDTTYDWLVYERPESPEAKLPPANTGYKNFENLTPTQIEERLCKKRISKLEYVKMWGSEEAIRRFTRHKLEARRLRKTLEKKHAQNAWLREKMRNHSRMIEITQFERRCPDQRGGVIPACIIVYKITSPHLPINAISIVVDQVDRDKDFVTAPIDFLRSLDVRWIRSRLLERAAAKKSDYRPSKIERVRTL